MKVLRLLMKFIFFNNHTEFLKIKNAQVDLT